MANWNRALFDAIYSFSHRSALLDALGVFLAQYLAYILVLVFLILVLSHPGRRRRLAYLFEGGLAIIVSRGILTELIRFVYPHQRPFQALEFRPLIVDNANSFPSGHAAFFFALSYVIFTRNKKWGLFFFAASFVVCIARIYAGVHWPADIAGGILVGLFSGVFVHYLLKPYVEKLDPAHRVISSEVTQ